MVSRFVAFCLGYPRLFCALPALISACCFVLVPKEFWFVFAWDVDIVAFVDTVTFVFSQLIQNKDFLFGA